MMFGKYHLQSCNEKNVRVLFVEIRYREGFFTSLDYEFRARSLELDVVKKDTKLFGISNCVAFLFHIIIQQRL